MQTVPQVEPESESLTYHDVIKEHQRLDIDFDETIAIIHQLFPDHINEAIALWNVIEARKLGVISKEAIAQ